MLDKVVLDKQGNEYVETDHGRGHYGGYGYGGLAGTGTKIVAGLGLGIGSLALLNGSNNNCGNGNNNGGILGGLFGGGNCCNNNNYEDRWTDQLQAENSKLKAELYSTNLVNHAVKEQTEINTKLFIEVTRANDAIVGLNSKLHETKQLLQQEISSGDKLEAERRECGDKQLYAWVDGHFVKGHLKMACQDIFSGDACPEKK